MGDSVASWLKFLPDNMVNLIWDAGYISKTQQIVVKRPFHSMETSHFAFTFLSDKIEA
jgi:hypothetical protein